MKKKKFFITIVLILVLSYAVKLTFESKTENGNDVQSIREKIYSLESIKGGSLEILDIKDIENNRIVSYLYNDQVAYIQFALDSNNNYEYIHSVYFKDFFGHEMIRLFHPLRMTNVLLTINSKFSNIDEFNVIIEESNTIVKLNQVNDVHYIELPIKNLKDFAYRVEISRLK